MSGALTIRGELVIPGLLLARYTMPDIEALLQAGGLLPLRATALRWRMDTETPGNYRLTYAYSLPDAWEPSDDPA